MLGSSHDVDRRNESPVFRWDDRQPVSTAKRDLVMNDSLREELARSKRLDHEEGVETSKRAIVEKRFNHWLKVEDERRTAMRTALGASTDFSLGKALRAWSEYVSWWNEFDTGYILDDIAKQSVQLKLNKEKMRRHEYLANRILLDLFEFGFRREKEKLVELLSEVPTINQAWFGQSIVSALPDVEDSIQLSSYRRQDNFREKTFIPENVGIESHPKYDSKKQEALELKNSNLSWKVMDKLWSEGKVLHKADSIRQYAKDTGQEVQQNAPGRPSKAGKKSPE